jgi:hypothetical protein
MAPTHSEPNQRLVSLFVGHQLNETHTNPFLPLAVGYKSPEIGRLSCQSSEKRNKQTKCVFSSSSFFKKMKKKKKKRISLNKHGEANKPTPPNTTRMPYGPLLDSLPHLDEYTQKTQSNKLPQAKKTTTTKKKKDSFFFSLLLFASGGGHFRP